MVTVLLLLLSLLFHPVMTEPERAEFWREHLRPAIRARQLKMAERTIDHLKNAGYLTEDDLRQLAARLDGPA